MRTLRRLVLAASFVGLPASAGFAQQGQITTGGGQTTGSIGGTGGLAGGGQAGQLGGGGTGAGTGSLGGTALQTMQSAPTISTAPTATTGGSGSADFIFGGYYANPYYQGLLTNTTAAPGGFGSALAGNSISAGSGGATGGGVGMRTTNTAARTGASAYGTTATRTGTTGAAGARTGATGARGGLTSTTANQAAVVVPLTAQITYRAAPQFATVPLAAPQVQTDVSGMIARSALANPAGVQVSVDAANTVVLRGTVADAAEARLAEGMVRLTPGVGVIRNELTFPVAATPTFPTVPGTTFRTPFTGPTPGSTAPVFPRP